MYEYKYDAETGGIILTDTTSLVSKEPRPVYAQELDYLGVDDYLIYEKQQDVPYMWAEAARYIYKGEVIFNTKGGSLYEKPILKLENALLERLKESGLDFVRNGARNHIPGNISVSFKDADGEAILHRLDLMGICISTGSACDSVSTQISHVLKAIKLKDNYARGTIRISFGKENTFEEANIIAESLIRILKK